MGIKHEERMLVEAGHKPAVWMSELDMEFNSGAHMNSESFVKADSGMAEGYKNGYGKMEDKTCPGARDIQVDWNSVDSKLGAEVSFNAKQDV
jgi:hypothetical protein